MNLEAWKVEAKAQLARDAWFSCLSEELKSEIVDCAELIQLNADDCLFRAGDPVAGFYCVLSGDFRALRRDAGTRENLIDFYGPNSWVGVVLSTECCPQRDFSVIAASSGQVMFITTAAYREIVTRTPSYAEAFCKLVCAQAAHAREAAFEQRFDASRRTARMLLHIANLHGRANEKGIELPISLSQGDLASLVGVSRQYMNGLIRQWHSKGHLHWSGESFPVLVMQRLNSLLHPVETLGPATLSE